MLGASSATHRGIPLVHDFEVLWDLVESDMKPIFITDAWVL